MKSLDERQEFLQGRRDVIGSSDIAKLVGLSPYGGELDLYLDKVGLLPARETPQTRWGLKLEEAVATAYEEETGRELLPAKAQTYVHPEYPFAGASPDRFTIDYERIVELKTARNNEGWGSPGTDEVPPLYLVQTQWQILVTGIELADIAVLIAGSDFRIYSIPRSEEIIATLVPVAAAFWERVQRREPPPPDWTDPRTPYLLSLLYRPQPGKEVSLYEEEHVEYANDYQRLGVTITDLEKQREICKGRLIEALKDAGAGVLPDGRRVTRTLRGRKGYTVEASDYTDFRIVKARR